MFENNLIIIIKKPFSGVPGVFKKEIEITECILFILLTTYFCNTFLSQPGFTNIILFTHHNFWQFAELNPLLKN